MGAKAVTVPRASAQSSEEGGCLHNLRRSPRIPFQRNGRFEARREVRRAVIEDVGAGGCLLVAHEELVRGLCVRVVLPGVADEDGVALLGKVVWTHKALAGVEFAPQALAPAERWFRSFLATQPELAARLSRIPTQLAAATPLYALPRPRRLVLSPDELAVYRFAQRRIDAAVLVSRSRLPPQRAAGAIFGLLEKNVLTLSPVEAIRGTPAAPLPGTQPEAVSGARPLGSAEPESSLDDFMRAPTPTEEYDSTGPRPVAVLPNTIPLHDRAGGAHAA